MVKVRSSILAWILWIALGAVIPAFLLTPVGIHIRAASIRNNAFHELPAWWTTFGIENGQQP